MCVPNSHYKPSSITAYEGDSAAADIGTPAPFCWQHRSHSMAEKGLWSESGPPESQPFFGLNSLPYRKGRSPLNTHFLDAKTKARRGDCLELWIRSIPSAEPCFLSYNNSELVQFLLHSHLQILHEILPGLYPLSSFFFD